MLNNGLNIIDDVLIKEAFAPFIQEILNTEVKKKDDNYRWVTTCIFDKGVLIEGGYRCDSTRITPENRRNSKKLLDLRQSIFPFSEIIFKSKSCQETALFVRGKVNNNLGKFKGNVFVIQQDFSTIFHELENTHGMDYKKIFAELSTQHQLLAPASSLLQQITKKYGDATIKHNVDITRNFLNFLCWLYFHDTDAHYWVYLPNPNNGNHIKGGAVLCFAKGCPTDDIHEYSENLGCCFNSLELAKELGIKHDGLSYSFATAFFSTKNLYKQEWQTFEALLSRYEPTKEPIPERTKKEKTLVKPHLWRLAINAGARWLSWFVWRHVYGQGDRIDFAVVQKGDSWHIKELEQRINLFSNVSENFHKDFDFIRYSENERDRLKGILSLGEMVLQKSIGEKKPVILKFKNLDSNKQDPIDSLKRLGFVLCDFSPYYGNQMHLFGNIKNEILAKKVSPHAYEITQRFQKLVNNKKTVNTIKDGCYREFIKFVKRQQSTITDEYEPNDIKTWLFNYLCWLIAHDPEACAVIFIPIYLRPNVPIGHAWIGLDENFDRIFLFLLKDYLESALLLESYISESCHPSFPVVYGINRLIYDIEWFALKAKKEKKKVTVAFIDLNGLKNVNTEFNQFVGSWYLGAFIYGVKQYFCEKKRLEFAKDFSFAVYGGDELVLVFYGIDCCTVRNYLRMNFSYIHNKWEHLLWEQVLIHKTRYGKKRYMKDIAPIVDKLGLKIDKIGDDTRLLAEPLSKHKTIEFKGFCAGIHQNMEENKEDNLNSPLEILAKAREKEELQKAISRYWRDIINGSLQEKAMESLIKSIPTEKEGIAKQLIEKERNLSPRQRVIVKRIVCELVHEQA